MKNERTKSPLVFVMVGLPARGKSFLARRLHRYLSWIGLSTRVFNVGDYRRQILRQKQGPIFFDPDNPEGVRQRHELATAALRDMEGFISQGGEVAIYDATNTTRKRRSWMVEEIGRLGARVVFVESITEDETLIEANIVDKQRHSPDYEGVPTEQSGADFRARLAHYQRSYEPISETELSFIQLIDAGRQMICNRIEGYLPCQAASFLMNQHLLRRPILLTRHGESEYNASGRIGGNSSLTANGLGYGARLGAYLRTRFPADEVQPLQVWTSTLARTKETAEAAGLSGADWGALDELEAGRFNGMTYEEISRAHPDEFEARQKDKLRYRYPRGESYLDVIERLHPLIMELERQRDPVLVVAHQAVLRVLYGYFMHIDLEECPHLSMPLHTVLELMPTSTGCQETRVNLA